MIRHEIPNNTPEQVRAYLAGALGFDDLLEVGDDEQQPLALELGDEALLEIALEHTRDAAADEAWIADRLERYEDD